MLQMLLALLQWTAVGMFALGALAFVIAAVLLWRKKRSPYLYIGGAAFSAVLSLLIWNIDLFTAESTDRAELEEAFRSNFGFDPPASVKDIKLKNVFIYDSFGHWMVFTYDPQVFERIVAHDQPLEVADARTDQFDAIVRDAFVKNENRPDWAVSPVGRTDRILYKKDFMDHTFSEYYLWVDRERSMVHLHVSYFD